MSSKPTSAGSKAHSYTALIVSCLITAAPYFVPIVQELAKQYPIINVLLPIGGIIWNNYVKPINSK